MHTFVSKVPTIGCRWLMHDALLENSMWAGCRLIECAPRGSWPNHAMCECVCVCARGAGGSSVRGEGSGAGELADRRWWSLFCSVKENV